MKIYKFKKYLGLDDYFYESKAGIIYSTKRSSKPYPMKWVTHTLHTSVKLQDGTQSGRIVKKHKLSMLLEDIPSKNYDNLFNLSSDEICVDDQDPQFAKLENDNFIIGTVTNDGELSFAKNPKQHNTVLKAKTEAERLATNFKTAKFVVVKIIGTVASCGVSWIN